MVSPRPTSLFDLSGKVAVVTGASKGIGRQIASHLAHHGAKVVVSSRKTEACDAVVADIKANWATGEGDAMTIPCHVGRREDCEALIAGAIDAWGKVDIFVGNAAVNPYKGPVADMPDWAYEKTMTANVQANIWLTNLVCPGMAERREGAIILLGSTGGLRGTDDLAVYGVTKAAVMQIVRNLTVEWGRFNIRANCIAPSLVRTDMAEALYTDPKRARRIKDTYPLGRIGEPDEIAGIAVALAAPAGSWMSGQTIVVDGGMMAGAGRYA